MATLRTENIVMQFGGLTAVNNFNLEINPGEIVALIGPNGAGKTTAFNMITGVYRPTSGNVFFNDKNITGMRPDKITELGIARTFQNIRLFKDLSVLDNIFIANHLRLNSNLFSAVLGLPGYKKQEKRMYESSLELLEKFELIDQRNEKASSLPYGKQRKLEIARALATNPQLLLLDEPAAGMNPKETEELTVFVKQIHDEFKVEIFMIEHHMHIVMDISDRIYVLDYGVTIASGNPYDIQNNQKVIEAYLGVSEDA